MKKNFYLLFLLTGAINLSAQTPGGIAGPVLWLKANAGAATAGTWSDNSGLSNSFSQADPSKWPVLNNNVFNFHEGLAFDGTKFLTQPSPLNFPTGNTDRTIFVVANATAVNGFRWIFSYGSPGTFSATFQTGNLDGNFMNAFYGPAAALISGYYWNLVPDNTNGALAAFTMASNVETQYDRGVSINTATTTDILSAPSANAVIGAIDATGAEPWAGSIAEVILYNSALSDADRNKVESYLALKYGLTLGTNTVTPVSYTSSAGTVFWNASPTFQNDVFGIGTDNLASGLIQQQSCSMNSGNGDGTGLFRKGNMTLYTASPLADDKFLMIGNDGGILDESTISAGQGPVSAEGSIRLVRNWKIQNTGSVGAADLSFDTTGLLTLAGGTTLSNYILMIDNDGDGNYATGPLTYIPATSSTGNKLNFTGITLPDNAVFTIITSPSATLPAIWQGFTATVQKNTATLTWKTSNEINVDHYTVEYSTNGMNFLTAGTVVAKNGAGINTYTLTQDNLPAGIRYYRIKRVDKDGKFEISETKSVKAGGAVTLVLKSNPIIKGRLDLNIDVPQNQDAVIRVVNIDGKIMLQQNNGLSTGTNSISGNVSHLAAGTYFLQVQLANEIINKKFVKL